MTLRFLGECDPADVVDAMDSASLPAGTASLGPAVDVLSGRASKREGELWCQFRVGLSTDTIGAEQALCAVIHTDDSQRVETRGARYRLVN